MRSTKVLFPRFEAEIPPEDTYGLGDVRKRAFPHGWLSKGEVEAVIDPVPEARAAVLREKDVKGRWWGVYHHAKEIATQEQWIDSPYDGGTTIYASRLLIHRYLWDEQATSGRAHEIVLGRWVEEEKDYRETAALLIEGHLFDRSRHARQQLVIRNEDGEWEGAQFEPYLDETRAMFYVAVMAELSMPGITAIPNKVQHEVI